MLETKARRACAEIARESDDEEKAHDQYFCSETQQIQRPNVRYACHD